MSFIDMPSITDDPLRLDRIDRNERIVLENLLRISNELLGTTYVPEKDYPYVSFAPLCSLLLVLQNRRIERGLREVSRRMDI